MYNASNGDDIPTLPQPWTGPPPTIVQVQAILYASLAASLFSAFLAMLGKQWLNRYASVDLRGSAIERSQNRQRKFDGIVDWYFDHVMGSPSLMLQAALLLLGCALSRYLWEINTTVASVVLGVTSFGVLFYLFIVVAGAAFVSCPYQTPGVCILRGIPDTVLRIQDALERILISFLNLPDIFHCALYIFHCALDIFHRVPDIIHLTTDVFHRIPHDLGVLHSVLVHSAVYGIPILVWRRLKKTWTPACTIPVWLVILLLPIWLILDVCRAVVWLLVTSSRWLQQESEQQTGVLDLHCISWTLRTSLDGPIHLSALKYLKTVISADFDPTLAVGCFDVLFGCIKPIDNKATITQAQGSEQLVTTSALYSLQMLPRLIDTNPRTYEDIRQRYTRAFPWWTHFDHRVVPCTLAVINAVLYSGPRSRFLDRMQVGKRMEWEGYKPSSDEHAVIAHTLAMVSRFNYPREMRAKVPRWILRFALHSLSQSPPPPTSVVANCLTIISIDLGRDPLHKTTLDERHVCT